MNHVAHIRSISVCGKSRTSYKTTASDGVFQVSSFDSAALLANSRLQFLLKVKGKGTVWLLMELHDTATECHFPP